MTAQQTLKLYIWEDPWTIKYGNSLITVIAGSEDEARARAIADIPPDRLEMIKLGSVMDPIPFYGDHQANMSVPKLRNGIYGPPDHIIDAPGVYWTEWSE